MQGIPVLGILGVWLVVTLALRLAVVLKVRGVGRQEMTERNYRSQRTPTVRRRQSGRERRMLVIALLCATLMGAALLASKESDFLRHSDTMLTPLRALFADQAEQLGRAQERLLASRGVGKAWLQQRLRSLRARPGGEQRVDRLVAFHEAQVCRDGKASRPLLAGLDLNPASPKTEVSGRGGNTEAN